jgi:hypothetical protein
MPWARLDDMLPVHPKVRALSDSAFRLYISAICWSNANQTDGHITAAHLRFVSDVSRPRACADQLVRAGLWEAADDGWHIHDYLEYQPSAEKVKHERELKRQRQERWRAGVDASQLKLVDASGDASSRARPHPIPSPDGSVVDQPNGSSAQGQDLILIESVKKAMDERGYNRITDDQAAHIATKILGSESVRNPAAYIAAAISRDPKPLRFLPPQPTPMPPAFGEVHHVNGNPARRDAVAAAAARARAGMRGDPP